MGLNETKLKELKEKFGFQFELPEFLKEFLHEFSQSNTFVKRHAKRLNSIPDEEIKEFVLQNRWLLYGWELPYHKEITSVDGKNIRRLNKVHLGDMGNYQYESFCYVIFNWESKKIEIHDGICMSPYCSIMRSKHRNIPKHSTHLAEKLFKDYEKWRNENGN